MNTDPGSLKSPKKGGPMSICLITPPSIILSKERTFPHLGIMKIGAVLKERLIDTSALDLCGVENYIQTLTAYLEQSNVTTFGITGTSPQIPAAVEIAREIRLRKPDARIILGGPHVTSVNAGLKQEEKKNFLGRSARAMRQLSEIFDVLVAGDGELAIQRVLKDPKIKFIDADNATSDLFLKRFDLNTMPFPDRDMVDIRSYEYSIDGVPATTMIFQLGCPFECGFCGLRNSDSFRRVRIRDVESVTNEIRQIHEKYGFRGFMIYDDELNVNPKMLELMEAIARLGDELSVEWRLRGFVKAELFTEKQAQAMYRAGFREILVGFESGSEVILKNIRKKATRDDNSRCVEIAKRAGLRVKALMSMGHPGESEKTVRETEEWLLSIEPDSFDLTRITVYPGTPYFDQAVPHPTMNDVWTYSVDGHRLHSYEVDYTTNFIFYKGRRNGPKELNKFYAFTDHLSADDLYILKQETEDGLRDKLAQPYHIDVPGIKFDHSMGMGLPEEILRISKRSGLD